MVALHIVIADREIDSYLLPESKRTSEPDAATHFTQLTSVADEHILMLQDLIDIGEATPEIQSRIMLWKRYRVALNDVPNQTGWPADVVWPDVIS